MQEKRILTPSQEIELLKQHREELCNQNFNLSREMFRLQKENEELKDKISKLEHQFKFL